MLDLLEITPSELNWDHDFIPQKPWPEILPLLAVVHQNRLTVVAGFDRKNAEKLSVLKIDSSLENLMNELYPPESLLPLESLRLSQIIGDVPEALRCLLKLPKELQFYLDEKHVPLKVLRPLEYLTDWWSEMTSQFLKLRPSSAQVREILDLLCDLKMNQKSWSECAPKDSQQPQNWVSDLFKLRNPTLSQADFSSAELVEKTPWPRGVRAKWERHGDRGMITIQARVATPKEFESLKKNLQQVEIEEKLWTH